MRKLLTILFTSAITFSYAQYCTSGGPSSTDDSDLGDITLNGETSNISILASCPGTLGVEDSTATQTADLMADSTYTLNIDFNTCGGNYSNVGEAWIDYNVNDVFDANESLGTWNGQAPSGSQAFVFTVPTWVCNGATRIRFMQQESGTAPLDPCGSFIWGAVIDASITLSNGTCQTPGCTDPLALNYNPIAAVDDSTCLPVEGKNCDTANVITSLPFSAIGLSTAMYGNDYNSTMACNSVFMDGDDYVFTYTPTEDTCLTITIANADFSTGLFLLDGCPDDPSAACVSVNTGSSATITGAHVEAGITYYIIVSTDGAPTSTSFDITIEEIICPIPNEQDCAGAILICKNYAEPNYYSGVGNIPDEVPSSSCLGSGEKNNVWYQFTSYQDGFLGFTIFPNTPSDDYDWAVYDISEFGCNGIPSDLSTELSCNYSPNVCADEDGSTGPNGDLSGPCAGQNEDLIPVDSGGTYVIVVSQFENESQDGYEIVFDENSVVSANNLRTEDQEICWGESADLEAKLIGPSEDDQSFTWYPSTKVIDSSIQNTKSTPLLEDSTYFYVQLKSGQCDFYDTLLVTTQEFENDFNIYYDSIISPVEVEFENLTEGEVESFFWDFANGDTSNVEDPENQDYFEPGQYIVSLVTESVTKDGYSCYDTTFRNVTVPEYYIPNIITPNGDGVNDLLVITGLREFTTLHVFNRWGKPIIEMPNYKNNWDGGDLKDGTYYYYVTNQNGDVLEGFKGFLLIQR